MADKSIFVSHAHEDNQMVDRYVQALRAAEYNVWYDRANVQLGDVVASEIQRALVASTIFIVFLTPAALKSYWVQLEVNAFLRLRAGDSARLLIPVLLAPVPVSEISPLLSVFQIVEAASQPFDVAIRQIRQAIESGLVRGTPTEPVQEKSRWGDPISATRQSELRSLLEEWNRADVHKGRGGPFDGVKLTGADVFWLATVQAKEEQSPVGIDLQLQGANLTEARLEGATLDSANLRGAILRLAQLTNASLRTAHLEGADLSAVQATGSDLGGAHLEGVDLSAAQLEQADLRWAWLDNKTFLSGATVDGKTRLGDIQWGGVGNVNLTNIGWEHIRRLGDELDVDSHADVRKHEAVVRAYRQLAAQLRAQGMTEAADLFAYRAQIRQRGVLLRRSRVPQYLFSWFLAILAGYGYRFARTVFWYVVVILSFTWAYIQVTHGVALFGLQQSLCNGIPTVGCVQPLKWYEALVLSVASFHGRGFFPQGINLGDPVAILAAAEAVVGLLIEVSFIATFTQRYFGAK